MKNGESDTWVWGQTHMVGRGEAYGTVQNIINESALTYEILMEEITTHDKSGKIDPNGQHVLPNGDIISDRRVYLQANMIREKTKSLNGEIVGDINVIQRTPAFEDFSDCFMVHLSSDMEESVTKSER
nr:hypothetical protein [Tanacetum cinerariifolium]